MSSAGTLLSDLDNRAPSDGDSDLVQKILADINGNSGGNPVQMPSRGMSAPPPRFLPTKVLRFHREPPRMPKRPILEFPKPI